MVWLGTWEVSNEEASFFGGRPKHIYSSGSISNTNLQLFFFQQLCPREDRRELEPTMLCPPPPPSQQQQPQSLQALARSRSLGRQQSQFPRTSQRCRSFHYNSGKDVDYNPDFSKATIEVMIKQLNSLNIKKSLSRLPLLSNGSHDDNSNHYKRQYQNTGSDDCNPSKSLLLSSPHADTDQDNLGNVTGVVVSVDSNPSVSPLPCISTHADTDYKEPDCVGSDESNLSDSLLPSSSPRDKPGNLTSEVASSGSNPGELSIDFGLVDENNNVGQPHHRTRVTALELTFMLVGFNLEVLSAGFDQVSSTSKPCYALISLLLAIAAVLTCSLELIYNGIKDRDASPSPNSTVFGTLPDIFGLGLAVIQCVCSAVQYYFLYHHASNPIKLSPVPLFFFTCLVVLKLKGN